MQLQIQKGVPDLEFLPGQVPSSHYEDICKLIRAKVVEMSCRARAAHLGSALSCVDLVVALYGGVLNIDPRKPHDSDRDRLIFSKGHACTTLYATLASFGFFPPEMLATYATNGSLLAEEPIPNTLPGVEVATGSLGHGLSLGLGMALAAKVTGKEYRTFVLMGDGECNEGTVWEAAMLAPTKKLDNLVAIVDFNKWQGIGRSEEIMALSPLREKFTAFGWSAHEVDGHNISEILAVLNNVPDGTGSPVAVIAHTVKGKGISFMEDDNNWHYRIPTEEELLKARGELGLL
jgi:transketolase